MVRKRVSLFRYLLATLIVLTFLSPVTSLYSDAYKGVNLREDGNNILNELLYFTIFNFTNHHASFNISLNSFALTLGRVALFTIKFAFLVLREGSTTLLLLLITLSSVSITKPC